MKTLSEVIKSIDWHMVVIGLLFFLLLIGFAGAQPITGAATLVGSNNATISCTPEGQTWWVAWGQNQGDEYWVSSNQSASSSSYTIHESPLFGNTVFYYTCCDQSGCGSEGSFLTLPVTPIPTLYIGAFYQNITESGYSLPAIAQNLVGPYVWNTDMPVAVIFMLIFSPLFIGIWLRSRTVLVALIFGFIVGSFLLYANAGLGLGMPPEITSIAQAFCYIAFAGCILYIVHR